RKLRKLALDAVIDVLRRQIAVADAAHRIGGADQTGATKSNKADQEKAKQDIDADAAFLLGHVAGILSVHPLPGSALNRGQVSMVQGHSRTVPPTAASRSNKSSTPLRSILA